MNVESLITDLAFILLKQWVMIANNKNPSLT